MPYTIQAQHEGHIVSQTRLQAASAIVLAMKWTHEGRQAIVIVTQDGRSHSLGEAKQRLNERLHL